MIWRHVSHFFEKIHHKADWSKAKIHHWSKASLLRVSVIQYAAPRAPYPAGLEVKVVEYALAHENRAAGRKLIRNETNG